MALMRQLCRLAHRQRGGGEEDEDAEDGCDAQVGALTLTERGLSGWEEPGEGVAEGEGKG